MDLQKNRAAFVAVILACCCWEAQAQPYSYPRRNGSCPTGVACIPKRGTYGFTPTKWRQWPAADKSAATPSEPENLPTPAKELPKVESEVPSEDSPLRPTETETEPAMPQTSGESPPEGLFDDSPPNPPKESDGETKRSKEPSESTDGLPNGPPQTRLPAPEDSDKPPAMEDEDPFKDDPIPRNEPPSAEPLPRGATKANPASRSNQASDRWRAGSRAQANLAESSPKMSASAIDEPGLLRVDDGRQTGRGILPIKPPGMRNPLRSEVAKPRENRIVPAVDWSADQVAASNEEDSLRIDHDRQVARNLLAVRPSGKRNPLRSEMANQFDDQVVPAANESADQAEPNDANVGWRRNPLRAN